MYVKPYDYIWRYEGAWQLVSVMLGTVGDVVKGGQGIFTGEQVASVKINYSTHEKAREQHFDKSERVS